MSQLTADAAGAPGMPPHGSAHPAMARDNITLPAGAGSRLAMLLLALGLAGLAVTVIAGISGHAQHAIAAAHVGIMSALAITLGSMFLVMFLHLTNAGWAGSIRRQLENIMYVVPIPALMALAVTIIEVASGGILFAWLDGERVAADPLHQHKLVYLNAPFFVVRSVAYLVVWFSLSRRMWWYSTEQDITGDAWLTARARFSSAWGALLLVATVTFAAFDWLMALDYRFFSTMWPVYFFAGSIYSSVALLAIVLAALRRQGKLEGVVTDEHFHDLGKLLFAFTVFWAYISFSQYFLIWYSNIPEETQWFLARKSGWMWLFVALCLGHFVIPWYLLLWRRMRRSAVLLTLMGVWALGAHALDIFWIVRPMVHPEPLGQAMNAAAVGQPTPHIDPLQAGRLWIDVAGFIGVWCTVGFFLVKRITAGVLVPLHDPRMRESLTHKNYV